LGRRLIFALDYRMNSKILVGFGVLGALSLAGAAGYGGWYAWDKGIRRSCSCPGGFSGR